MSRQNTGSIEERCYLLEAEQFDLELEGRVSGDLGWASLSAVSY